MASALRTRRIMEDLKDFQKGIHDIVLTHYEDNLSCIKVAFTGSPETPYAEGTFNIDISIPDKFPFKCPTITFKTPVWHPNVSKLGKVCMDLLDTNWDSGTTLIEYADASRGLLNDPNPLSPLNLSAAHLLDDNEALYMANAKVWTRIHAGGMQFSEEIDEKLSVLVALGMDEKRALLKGAENAWDMTATVLACGL